MSAAALPEDLVHHLQSRELGAEDYHLLLQLDAVAPTGPAPLQEHLAAALPLPSEPEVAAACARGDGLCQLCSTPVRTRGGSGLEQLRKAPCGAVLHASCLQARFARDKDFLCPCCAHPLFNGLRPPGRPPFPLRAQQSRRAGERARTQGAGTHPIA